MRTLNKWIILLTLIATQSASFAANDAKTSPLKVTITDDSDDPFRFDRRK